MRAYLDWNATTPPHPDVVLAIGRALEASWGNPASVHADGRHARAEVERARASVAALLGADPRDVLLTSGGTEANNLALRSAFSAREAEGRRALVTSRLEHPSVTRVAEALEAEGRAEVRWLAIDPGGTIRLEDLERALAPRDVALVALQAVNQETGAIQPLAAVAPLVARAGARLHVDVVQALGKIDLPEVALADTLAVASHKLRGPKGVGALVCRPHVRVTPLLLGGAQERGLRPGTVDPVACAGFHAALARAAEACVQYARIAARRDALEDFLASLGGVPVLPRGALRVPHVASLTFRAWSGPELVAALDLEGVSVSSGSACSAGTVEASPVLVALVGAERAGGGLRVSLGEATTDEELAFAREAFARVLSRGRVTGGRSASASRP